MRIEREKSQLSCLNIITNLLKSLNIPYDLIEHKAFDGKSGNSAQITGMREEQGAKALIFILNGEKPMMVVLRGSDRVDKKALKKITGSKDIRFATLNEVKKFTNLEVGTLPAIGSVFNLPTLIDNVLLQEKIVAIGTGLFTKTILLRPSSLAKFENSMTADFSQTEVT